jgi:hypothetical protein
LTITFTLARAFGVKVTFTLVGGKVTTSTEWEGFKFWGVGPLGLDPLLLVNITRVIQITTWSINEGKVEWADTLGAVVTYVTWVTGAGISVST